MRKSGTTLDTSHLAAGKIPNSFRLLRNYTVISLASVIITSLLLGTWVRQISIDNLILSEERSNIALTQVLAHMVWPQFASFIEQADQLEAEEIRSHATTWELDQFINDQVMGLDVLKIKIYNLDGMTVFSSDFKQIGKSKRTHRSFMKSRNGQVISKLSFRDKIYAQNEFIQNRNVIASYVPIRTGKNNRINGVFEVYKDVTPIIGEINKTQTKVIAGVVTTLTVLFFVLYFVVRRADRIIQEQNEVQKKVTEQISHVAFYDSLTGLPNRVLFMERLEHAMQVATRSQTLAALMFIDLDRFKQVNDNLGHEAGDQLLRQVAGRLNGCIRSGDTVSRISGDEFTILLENLNNIETSTHVAQRIVNQLAQPFHLGQNEVFISCSIGMSVYPFCDDDAESLVKKADAAMYFSKQSGRNSYHYYSPDMLQHGSKRYELEKDLNIAIANSQFRVFFQPKVCLDDWVMHGMEALIRWEHPEHGMIPPDQFIPILEETGKIIQVGEWVLKESCQHARKWQDHGLPPLRVAVNVSAIQFHQPGFYESVHSVLKETGLDAQFLELELTESCLIDDINSNIEIMQALKKLGVKLTIDDFGTGYSSLNYLCKLPVDTLKIDRSFLRDIVSDRKKRSITTAIISFAHGLRLDVVAEGIETTQQLNFVTAMRCTSVQGYLLSRPLNQDDFDQLYRSGSDFGYLKNAEEAIPALPETG